MHAMLRILHEIESKFLNYSRVLNQDLNYGLRLVFFLFMFQENLFMVYKKEEDNDEVK